MYRLISITTDIIKLPDHEMIDNFLGIDTGGRGGGTLDTMVFAIECGMQ